MSMLRSPALIACTLLSAGLALPSAGRAALHPGVEIGLEYSTFRYEKELPGWDVGWSPSFTGGFKLEIPVHDPISILTGVRYVRMADRVKYDTGSGIPRQYGEFRLTQDYVSVPVLMEHRFMHTGRLAFCFGPEFGYLVAAHLKTDETLDDGVTLTPRTSDDDVTDALKRFDLALDFSAGYDFPVGKQAWSLTLRYRRSLMGSAKDDRRYGDWRPHALEGLRGYGW